MLFPNFVILIAGLVLPAMAARIELGARQTSPVHRLPAAKLPPAPAPTEPPTRRWGTVALFDRAGDDVGTDTCGYIDGTRESSFPNYIPNPKLFVLVVSY